MPSAKSKNLKINFLAVDIGNTYIHFALMQGAQALAKFGVESALTGAVLKNKLRTVLRALPKMGFERAVICSVVPAATQVVESILKTGFALNVVVIGRDRLVPLKNRYKNPKQVGQDRLVCAYAAGEQYGYPAIIVDLGTAITLDAVSAKKEYLGGIIVPGIKITTETLFERTALLPLVKFETPTSLIGRDTKESILSGIYFGYGEMLKGLIHLLKKKVSARAQVIITGGHAELMAAYIKEKGSRVDHDLVMKGLARLA